MQAADPDPIACLTRLVSPGLRDLAAKRLATNDLFGYLGLFGSHNRWVPLFLIQTRLGPPQIELQKLFAGCWTEAKNLTPRWVVEYLFTQLGEPPKAFNAEDLVVFEALPEEFTIYRGFRGPNRKSRSWTLSKERAAWFAERPLWPGAPRVSTLNVKKTDVLFYSNERQEQEIVLRVPMAAKVRSAKARIKETK